MVYTQISNTIWNTTESEQANIKQETIDSKYKLPKSTCEYYNMKWKNTMEVKYFGVKSGNLFFF